MPLPPVSATTRRTAVLGAVAGLLGATGCEADGSGPRPGRGRSGAGRAAPTEDPDSALLASVTRELDELQELVAAARRRAPGAAAELAGLAALHRAHRAVLPGTGGGRSRVRLVGGRRSVVRRVLARERRAGDRLADWAVAAESGSLARLLASMSAAIAQQLAALDPGRAIR